MAEVSRRVACIVAVAIALMTIPGMAVAAQVIGEGAPPTTANAPAAAVTTAEARADAAPAEQAPSANRVVQVRTRVVVRNVLPDAAKNLSVVVPPTVINRSGTQRVLDVTFVTEPSATRQTLAGVEATYRVSEVPGFASITFEQVYTVELLGSAQGVIEESIDTRYLAAEPGIESDNAAIRSKALAVTRDLTSTEQKAEAIIAFVVGHLTYDLAAPGRNKGALAGFQARTGVCQEYASLFVAMARASDIPARLVYGWARDTGLEGELNGANRHVWAEYYDAQRGWVAVDPTFAEGQADLLAFGSQDHIAEAWSNTNFSASFGGRGLLSIVANQTLSPITTAQR